MTDEAELRAAHARFEERVAAAMTAPDPVAAIHALAEDPALPDELRRAARAAATQPRGIELTALLIARLRFERLMQGSREAPALFERDPAGFVALFRAYHREVAPCVSFPVQEGRLFAAWLATRPPGVQDQPGHRANPGSAAGAGTFLPGGHVHQAWYGAHHVIPAPRGIRSSSGPAR